MSREERGEGGENCMRIAFPDTETLGLWGCHLIPQHVAPLRPEPWQQHCERRLLRPWECCENALMTIINKEGGGLSSTVFLRTRTVTSQSSPISWPWLWRWPGTCMMWRHQRGVDIYSLTGPPDGRDNCVRGGGGLSTGVTEIWN